MILHICSEVHSFHFTTHREKLVEHDAIVDHCGQLGAVADKVILVKVFEVDVRSDGPTNVPEQQCVLVAAMQVFVVCDSSQDSGTGVFELQEILLVIVRPDRRLAVPGGWQEQQRNVEINKQNKIASAR